MAAAPPPSPKAANADVDQVSAFLREMEAEGQVKRTGQRRGMRWHVAGAKR